MSNLNAKQFITQLEALRSPEGAASKTFIGLSMGKIFALAKTFTAMPLSEIERLLESPIHKVRVGAVSIMDFQARSKKTDEASRKALFELYLRRHDRIDNWDLVDRAAPHVVGGYLFDKPRDVLEQLAHSDDVWERRTAIVSTQYFIQHGDVEDTFRIAEMLLEDDHNLIHTAIGGWLREAGKKDPKRLLAFLDQHAVTMPRTALRFAIEHLDQAQRNRYLNLKKGLAARSRGRGD
jgi:3-methyladenine DNA glycosylase AlkD